MITGQADYRINLELKPLEFYTAHIREKRPFALSVWGDGEWLCTTNDPRFDRSGSGQIFYPDLRKEMNEILQSKPKYFLGTDEFSFEVMGDKLSEFLKNLNLTEWHNWRSFRYAAEDGTIFSFLNVIHGLSTIMVGAEHLRVNKVFNWKGFVTTPLKNSFLEKDRILQEVRTIHASLPKPTVIFFCTGLAAPGMIHQCHAEFGNEAFLIDLGSLWDGILGIKNRTWHKLIKPPQIGLI